MNILSIDFDFFQKIPKEALSAYPDGIDLPTDVSNIIWASHMTLDKKRLDTVVFDTEKFEFIKQLLKKQKPHTKIMIASSHKTAYAFILETLYKTKNENTALTNIDLHHDLGNNNPNVDCGNWIKHLLKEGRIKGFQWVLQPESQKVYDLSDDELKQMHATTNINIIKDTMFDAIFICRSNPWLHPKFDTQFDELFRLCSQHFKAIIAEPDVRQPRQIPLKEMEGAISCLQHTPS